MEEPKIKPQFKLVATYYVGECAGNAEKSVIKAGYSPRYARGNAHKIVARRDVQEYIAYLRFLRENDPASPALHIATINEIQSFWTNVMNSTREKTTDRLKASEYLAKAQGMFNTDW